MCDRTEKKQQDNSWLSTGHMGGTEREVESIEIEELGKELEIERKEREREKQREMWN